MMFEGYARGKKKRAAPVLNSRIVQIEASFICSLLEFSLRAFFFLGWRFRSDVRSLLFFPPWVVIWFS